MAAHCPSCGMRKDEWKENNGAGYEKDGTVYCCRGCAEGTGCTCTDRLTEESDAAASG